MEFFSKKKDKIELEDDILGFENPPLTPEPEVSTQTSNYNIDNILQLMRKLKHNKSSVEIVIQTLESAQINIDPLIKQAKQKISDIDETTKRLQNEIKNFHHQINLREQEIAGEQKLKDETQAIITSFSSILEEQQEAKNPLPSPTEDSLNKIA